MALPSWLASITQRSVLLNVTVEPEIVHTDLLPGSMLRITRLPDPPPDAVTAYLSPTTGADGGEEVNLMVCGISMVPELGGWLEDELESGGWLEDELELRGWLEDA